MRPWMNKKHVKNVNILCPLCGKVNVANCANLTCHECQWPSEDGCVGNLCDCYDGDVIIALYAKNVQLQIELSAMIDEIHKYHYYVYRSELEHDRLYKKKGEY